MMIGLRRLRPHTLLNPFPVSHLPHCFSSPTMSSFSSSPSPPPPPPSRVIEHIVLFKVKQGTDPAKINAMMSGLNGLNSLDHVLYLSAGPVLRSVSSSAQFSFTHMLHSRYATKDELQAYSDHPDHLRVVRECGQPICEDIMAIDWIAEDLPGPVAVPPGFALKIRILKLKEKLADAAKDEVFGAIKGIKHGLAAAAIEQHTFGENFSPGRAKGFSVASLAVFKGASEMEPAEPNKGLHLDSPVRDYLEDVLVIDFAVPAAASSL